MKPNNKKARRLHLHKMTLNNLTRQMQTAIKGGSVKCVQNALVPSEVQTNCTNSGRTVCTTS
jgi:hypothetical protein